MKYRIAIVASHPIQYHAHWYRDLAQSPEFDPEVLYCHRPAPHDQAVAGFGVSFEWDTPLLEGYRYRFLQNASREPGVTTFLGTDSPEIRALIVRERYDAVIVSGWHTRSYVQAIRACLASGTPVLVRSDSHLHETRSALRQALKYLPWRYFISRFDACLAAGAWSRDYFLHYGARPERIFIVPHSVDGPATPVDALREKGRGRWQIPQGATVFLFAGKFVDLKRPGDFIQAVAQAAAGGSRAYGLLAGDGPMRPAMEDLARSLNAPVTFTGFLNQSAMPEAYAAADALVLPSSQETWGLVVNEAMTHGRPCVVADHTGCAPDLIVPERTGFVFPVGDVAALVAHLRRLADSPGLAPRMGEEARSLIAAHSPQAATRELARAVTAIMDSR